MSNEKALDKLDVLSLFYPQSTRQLIERFYMFKYRYNIDTLHIFIFDNIKKQEYIIITFSRHQRTLSSV